MTNKTKIELPSMLAFERKLETSDGLMFSGNWGDKGKEDVWKPIPVVRRLNRSTQSSTKTSEYDKTQPNPVASDSDDANLFMDDDTLMLKFSLRVIGNLGKPFACNKPDFAQVIETKTSDFKDSDELDNLAFRYAYNIANGRFLWRNRVGAEKIEIQVSLFDEKEPLPFNAYDFSLNEFNKNKDDAKLAKVTTAIKNGLSGDENTFVLIKVEAFVKLGNGQHVFPSQEMNMGEKKKKLFQLDGCAAMHNVKIGNALRTIDTWYGETMLIKAEGKNKTETVDIDNRIPIAIEPYGSVTQHGRAYRPSKNDLYTLMQDWINNKEIDAEQQQYVVGNLIRGGVFGGAGE